MKRPWNGTYNCSVKILRLLLPALVLIVATGCQKNIQTNEAVRKGVIEHLSKNKNLQVDSMDIEVASVTFRDKEADVTVSFKPKGGAAESGMQMRYTLERKGNEWVVQKKADSGAGHGMGMPGAAGEGMGAAPGGAQMPPNHPPMGAAPDAKK